MTTAETSETAESGPRYNIYSDFERNFDKWVSDGKPGGRTIRIGVTPEKFSKIGIPAKQISVRTSKLRDIQKKHLYMTDAVLKRALVMIDEPTVILTSKTQPNSAVFFGEAFAPDENGNDVPALSAVLLRPSRNGYILDEYRVKSAYFKTKDVYRNGENTEIPDTAATQELIDSSEILYIDPDKKRTQDWLDHTGLQLPFAPDQFGSINKISFVDPDVKGNFSFGDTKTEAQDWQKKLGELFAEGETETAAIGNAAHTVTDGTFRKDARFSVSDRDAGQFTAHKYYSNIIRKIEQQNPTGYTLAGRIGENSIYTDIGIPADKVYFDNSKILKELNKKGGPLPKEYLLRVPEILADPIVASEADTKNTVNVFGNVRRNGVPVMVGIVVTRDRTGRNVVNKIRTVHSRGDAEKLINDDTVLYLNENKNKTKAWFQASRIKMPLGGTKFGLIRRIALSDDLVNDKYSQSDRDYLAAVEKGDMETAQRMVDDVAKAAFADSEQAKSADPVTYDDAGNVILLSERFNPANEDVRFSLKEIDGEVMPVLDTANVVTTQKAAKNYLNTLINQDDPFSTILADAWPVYIGKDLPR